MINKGIYVLFCISLTGVLITGIYCIVTWILKVLSVEVLFLSGIKGTLFTVFVIATVVFAALSNLCDRIEDKKKRQQQK